MRIIRPAAAARANSPQQQTHNPPDAQQQSHNDETRNHRTAMRRPRMLKYTSRLLPRSLKCACGYAPRARVRSSSPSLSSNQKNESASKIAQKTLLTDAHSHVHATRRRRCTSPCAKRRVLCLNVTPRELPCTDGPRVPLHVSVPGARRRC